MYRRILVAVDGSEVSQLAMAEAVRLARRLEALLCVAHGIDVVTTNAYKSTDFDEFVAPQAEAGHAVLAKATELAREAGVRCEERLLEIDVVGRSRLPEAIVLEAGSWEADLILVGTRGRRGFSHLLLGSVAEGVVRSAIRPVLVVPATATTAVDAERPYDKVFVAVDGSDSANRALREAIGLAQALQSVMRVVYVADGSGQGDGGQRAEELLGAAQAQVRDAGVEVQTATLQSPPQPKAVAEALLADAVAWGAHLLALGTHGRPGLERMRLGSVAETVLPRSPAPVLLVRSGVGPAVD
jgi:nucleotide-binding universal stress UspA family protein